MAYLVMVFPLNVADVTERFVARKRLRADEEEKLYTLEEVKRIVAQVVAEREAALRQEYDQALQRQLEGTFAFDLICHLCLGPQV